MVVVNPAVGVYTSVVIAGSRLAKGSPNFLDCHLYVIVLAPEAETEFEKGGKVSPTQMVVDT